MTSKAYKLCLPVYLTYYPGCPRIFCT